MTKEKYVWVKNPKGVRVEVEAYRLPALLQQGYSELEDGKFSGSEKVQVALITELASNYSGGRYHTWELALSMQEAGFKVTVFADKNPPFIQDFIGYKQPKLVICDLHSLSVKADMYIGSPVFGTIKACQLAVFHKRPVYSLLFDALPAMHKYKGRTGYRDVQADYWKEFENNIKMANATILANSNMTKEYTKKWLSIPEERIKVFYPLVNEIALKEAEERVARKYGSERENWFVWVSRVVPYKNVELVLEAVSQIPAWELHIVTSTGAEKISPLIKKYGLQGRIHIHNHINDIEKFELFWRSKIMLNASLYEGAGMWLQEAQACGLYTVCYDFPTLRELNEAKSVVWADYNYSEAFKKRVEWVVVRYGDKPAPTTDKYFLLKKGKEQVSNIFRNDVKIGVIMIALNEEKFIGGTLRGLIESEYIDKIAVVEGAVHLYSHAATSEGLSIDNTSKTILDTIKKYDKTGKVLYDKYGWAVDKSELRNRALDLINRGVNWILMVDADEAYKEADLKFLKEEMEKGFNITTFYFPHYHFWKTPDRIAVGGQWDEMLPRCFRFDNNKIRYAAHAHNPVDADGIRIDDMGERKVLNNVHIYHYGYMKDSKDVKDKLKFYRKRDKHLNVKDTYTNWEEGKETQPTHGGGSTETFKGSHPKCMRSIIKQL